MLKTKGQKHTKSAKHIKNPNNNIFGGLKAPKNDKQYMTNNLIKKQAVNYGLISGFDCEFKNELEFKDFIKSFKPPLTLVNCRHNLNLNKKPQYINSFIGRFDIMAGYRL